MTVPARLLLPYLHTATSWSLRDESGRALREIDAEYFQHLARTESVFGVGSKTRLKYLQLMVPFDQASERVRVAIQESIEDSRPRKTRNGVIAEDCNTVIRKHTDFGITFYPDKRRAYAYSHRNRMLTRVQAALAASV